MKATYETTFVATCPVDESVVDIYELTIFATETIPVEAILEATQRAALAPAFQEDITQAIAAAFPAATVETRGVHSGVRTTVEASA